jgi:TPR repeat protein
MNTDHPWRWDAVAKELPGHTEEQCREKYMSKIPFNEGDWTVFNDMLLLILQHKEPDKWDEFTRWLPGKSANDIRKRWVYVEDINRRAAKQRIAEQEASKWDTHRRAAKKSKKRAAEWDSYRRAVAKERAAEEAATEEAATQQRAAEQAAAQQAAAQQREAEQRAARLREAKEIDEVVTKCFGFTCVVLFIIVFGTPFMLLRAWAAGGKKGAVGYDKLAADQNDGDAQCHYTLCDANGRVVSKDEVEPARYYELDADQNDGDAQSDDSVCLVNG